MELGEEENGLEAESWQLGDGPYSRAAFRSPPLPTRAPGVQHL